MKASYTIRLRQLDVYKFYRYNNKFSFGYFAYLAKDKNSDFDLVFSNETMYDKWNTGVECLRMDDKYYSRLMDKCEILEVQYGDRGRNPGRVRFE